MDRARRPAVTPSIPLAYQKACEVRDRPGGSALTRRQAAKWRKAKAPALEDITDL
jgi:hypothetical protein